MSYPWFFESFKKAGALLYNMANQTIEFITTNKKELVDLGTLLDKLLPASDVAKAFSKAQGPTYGFSCKSSEVDWHKYLFITREKREVFYEYVLRKGLYHATLNFNNLPQPAYSAIKSTIEEGFPKLFRQEVGA